MDRTSAMARVPGVRDKIIPDSQDPQRSLGDGSPSEGAVRVRRSPFDFSFKEKGAVLIPSTLPTEHYNRTGTASYLWYLKAAGR